MENILIIMEIFMKEIIKIINLKVMEDVFMLMVIFMKVI
jgi:hypothetical protein